MTTDVIVVGAGPTGLMTACELARRGVRVEVLDAASGPFPGSRGKGVQPRTLELLDRLGLADRMVSLGRFRMPLRRWSAGADGEPLASDFDAHPGAEPTPDSPYARTLMIPQWRTEQVLREHLAELGVTVRWGTAVRDVTQDDDGVTVSTDAGPLRAAWARAADPARTADPAAGTPDLPTRSSADRAAGRRARVGECRRSGAVRSALLPVLRYAPGPARRAVLPGLRRRPAGRGGRPGTRGAASASTGAGRRGADRRAGDGPGPRPAQRADHRGTDPRGLAGRGRRGTGRPRDAVRRGAVRAPDRGRHGRVRRDRRRSVPRSPDGRRGPGVWGWCVRRGVRVRGGW